MKDAAGVCAQPKSGLTWGNTVQQEPRKMSKAMSTSTSQRMWWGRRKRTWTRSWARWIREALTISCPGWHSSVYEFSTTTTATRISSNVDYQLCHYHSLIEISIHLATHHQKKVDSIKRGSTFIRDREKERTSCLCILSKSMLINFGIESIFVKFLRRYHTNYYKQHIWLFEGHINTIKTK